MINILALLRATLHHFWEGRQSIWKKSGAFIGSLLGFVHAMTFGFVMPSMSSSESTGDRISAGRRCILPANHSVKIPLCSLMSTPPSLMGLQSLKTYFAFSVAEPEAEDTQTQLHRTDLRWTYSTHNVPVKIRCGPGRSKVKIQILHDCLDFAAWETWNVSGSMKTK